MDTTHLWNLPPEKFNEWRRAHDYPALFKVFDEKLPHYKEWLEGQNLSSDLLFRHGFARFISSEKSLLLCEYKNNNTFMLFEKGFTKLNSIRKSGWIEKETEYQPYFYWLKNNYDKKTYEDTKREFRISSWIGGRPQFLKEHFLLNLGGVQLTAPILSGRLLDFTCLDNLKITGAVSNTHIHLWHCSAIGLEISGSLAFLDFYNTKLWDRGYGKVKQELTLKDGIFQDFHFKDCELNFHATRSTLSRCSIDGSDFDATLEHTKINGFLFRSTKSKTNHFHSRKKFYAKAKSLYSSVGSSAEAGEYFFKEKKNHMLSLLFPKKSNRESWHNRNTGSKLFLGFTSYLKFLSEFGNYVVWGFGERPIRSLFLSVGLIVASALIYFLSPDSATYENPIKSIYFSIVTFVTLGYGDISQKEPWLQIYSSIQAFSGMFLMGLFLAGFASKSKSY
ncbi:potassium channel family protein [Shewanella colwelliana]|uniref:potassium channel family protein n=1 Tax=Shewanella colwelliana TaxID=23 RepID=UPI00299E6BF6|nr:potassium channel family protein [Shewanella colwelliana]MDX1283165.1 potassium channel family protein [Shewanella colwelliana]